MPYSWLDLDTVKAAEPAMRRRGVSEQARGPEGFLTAYERAGGRVGALGKHKSGQSWRERRDGFLSRHTAQMDGDGWEEGPEGSRPTRRHLALVAWAYSPTPDRLRRWLKRSGLRDNPRRDVGDPMTLRTNPTTTRSVIRKLPARWRDFATEHVHVVQAIVADDIQARKARRIGGLQVVPGGRSRGEVRPLSREEAREAALEEVRREATTPPLAEVPEGLGAILAPVDRTFASLDPDLYKRSVEHAKPGAKVKMPAGILLQSRDMGPLHVTTEEFVLPPGGGLATQVPTLILTEDGWTKTGAVRLTRKNMTEEPLSPLTPRPLVGIDPVAFLEDAITRVRADAERRRREKAAEAARLKREAERAPYIATIFREEAKDRWFSDYGYGIPDTYEARVLRKLFRKLGIPLSIRVRRYSMASGFDLGVNLKKAPPGSTQQGLPLDSKAGRMTAEAFPTLVQERQYRDDPPYYFVSSSIHLREREDRSDLQSDYHDPGGARIAAKYAPVLREIIRKTKPTKREQG